MKFINLRQFRKDKNLTQKELVSITGLPQSTVSYIENGYQEIREHQLAVLRHAFPEVSFAPYIYESSTYPNLNNTPQHDVVSNRTFPGDWSKPCPMGQVDGLSILMKMGRAAVSFEGHIVLDRNDGTFMNFGYHVINPDSLGNSRLMEHLTTKGWFNDELYEDFKRCYLIACCLVGKSPVKQVQMGNRL